MKRVTGIGGIFIKSKDPERLRAWYQAHLGMEIEEWGGVVFQWSTPEVPVADGMTIWNIFEEPSDYFHPSEAQFMINYRVEDLNAVLDALRSEGCNVVEKTVESELGKFGWVIDPDGNKVELWEPPTG